MNHIQVIVQGQTSRAPNGFAETDCETDHLPLSMTAICWLALHLHWGYANWSVTRGQLWSIDRPYRRITGGLTR